MFVEIRKHGHFHCNSNQDQKNHFVPSVELQSFISLLSNICTVGSECWSYRLSSLSLHRKLYSSNRSSMKCANLCILPPRRRKNCLLIYSIEAEIVEDVNFKMSISPVRHDYQNFDRHLDGISIQYFVKFLGLCQF